jgi:hypothetical protein
MTTRLAPDRMAFREEQIVLEDGRRFCEAGEWWQYDDFEGLDDPPKHGYLERRDEPGGAGTEITTELVVGQPRRANLRGGGRPGPGGAAAPGRRRQIPTRPTAGALGAEPFIASITRAGPGVKPGGQHAALRDVIAE